MDLQTYYRPFAAAGIWVALSAPAWAVPATVAPPQITHWLPVLTILVLGGVGGWGVGFIRRRLRVLLGDPGLSRWTDLLANLIQVALWFGVFWIAASQLPFFDPLLDQLEAVFRAVGAVFSQVLQSPVLTIDRTPFSLGTLLLLLVLAITVFWASRVLADLFKRSLLSRLNLTVGSQAAIASVFNYAISAIGYILLLQLAGIDLGSLALLLGVVGLGIGLALQNLVRNFLSGLVLLVERPIQVGDYIQVDNKDGVVERISLRATSLRRFDGARMTIPNATLVEQNVLNWSNVEGRIRLSLEVPVGIYSDPEQVTEALLKIADEEPRVLYDPSPEVIFRGWQDSGMVFDLWAWTSYSKEQIRIRSALYYKIDSELRRRGITLPVSEHHVRLQTLRDALPPEVSSPGPTNGKNA